MSGTADGWVGGMGGGDALVDKDGAGGEGDAGEEGGMNEDGGKGVEEAEWGYPQEWVYPQEVFMAWLPQRWWGVVVPEHVLTQRWLICMCLVLWLLLLPSAK